MSIHASHHKLVSRRTSLWEHIEERQSSYVPALSLSSALPQLMKFLGKLWKRVRVLQNGCFSWKHSIVPLVLASLLLYSKCFYVNCKICSLPFACADVLFLGLTIHFKLHEICFLLRGFTWTNLIINRITATWLLAGIIYICSDSQDDCI